MSTVLRSGQTIAGYRVEELLASGGMGVVYRATQLSLGRTVALKVLAPHLSGDAEFRERFRREAAVQARLDHPHIVTVYETGESEEGLFLALKFVDGTDMRRLIDSGELSAERALTLLEQVASALDAAHALGLVHRDIKPQNVLVGSGDRAYLADFGLMKSDEVRELTKAGMYLGSLDYVSPEQVRGEPVTAASDRYAFAALLYESLAGEVPFPRDTEAAVLYAHVSEAPPLLTVSRPDLPAELDAVLARGLAKEPSERYATAAELVAAAQGAFDLHPVAPPRAAQAEHGPANGRARFGETVVDPGVLRRAPVIASDEGRGLPAKWVLAVGALVCAGLGVAGFLLGHSWTHVRHSAVGVAVAGPIQLSFPSGDWRPVRPPRGTEQQDPVALESRRDKGNVVAGMTPGVRPKTLLPPGSHVRGKRSLVSLGRYDALRYRSLGPKGNVDVYAVPVGTGAATITCSGALETLERCESVASTLFLRGVTPGTVGPDPRYAASLRTLFRRVDAARSAERKSLARAAKPGERAGHAEVLASAFATAAVQLGAIPAGARERPVQAKLQRALGRARDAYVSLASSIRGRDHDAYLVATRRVHKAERQADAALRSLRTLGYRVP